MLIKDVIFNELLQLNSELIMKNFLEKYKFILGEYPYIEIWVALVFILVLFLLGFISFGDLKTYTIITLLFLAAFAVPLSLRMFWFYKKTGAFWYFYSVLFYGLIAFHIYEIFHPSLYKTTALMTLLYTLSIFAKTCFATMVLMGKNYFNRVFWKAVFVFDIALIPVFFYDTYRVVALVDGGVNFYILTASFIFIILVFMPLYIRLYKYAFLGR